MDLKKNYYNTKKEINKEYRQYILKMEINKKKDNIKITFKMELKNSTIIMGSLSGNVNLKMVSLNKVLR